MFQQITLIGNLGRDPEMRYTPSGQPVTNFSVATSRNYTNSAGEKIEETVWFRITAWGKQAEVCNQYLRKGSKVMVQGHLTAGKDGSPVVYEKKDGGHAAAFEVTSETVKFLSSRGEGGSEQPADTGEEIPF